jgi:hypothetical protein
MGKLAIAVGVFMGVFVAALLFKETVSHWIQWCLELGFSSFTLFQ